MIAIVILAYACLLMASTASGICSFGSYGPGSSGLIGGVFGHDDSEKLRPVPKYGEGVTDEDIEEMRAMLSGGN